MLRRPQNWRNHYWLFSAKVRLARKFSFSDRGGSARPEVQESLGLLLANLAEVTIPLSLLSQYMPVQYG